MGGGASLPRGCPRCGGLPGERPRTAYLRHVGESAALLTRDAYCDLHRCAYAIDVDDFHGGRVSLRCTRAGPVCALHTCAASYCRCARAPLSPVCELHASLRSFYAAPLSPVSERLSP